MSTLGELKQHRMRITIHCETRLCVHYTEPSVDQLIQYLGADFDLHIRRDEFLARFVCERCGSRNATMRIAPPKGEDGLMEGSGTAHNHGPLPSRDEVVRREAEREAERKRLGIKSNAEIAQEARAKLRAERRAARAGKDFIGPPNPYRKNRWL